MFIDNTINKRKHSLIKTTETTANSKTQALFTNRDTVKIRYSTSLITRYLTFKF